MYDILFVMLPDTAQGLLKVTSFFFFTGRRAPKPFLGLEFEVVHKWRLRAIVHARLCTQGVDS